MSNTSKILLVDNFDYELEKAREALLAEDFEVEHIVERDAITYEASMFKPDVIVVVNGKENRGIGICKYLHRSSATKDVPIILVDKGNKPDNTLLALKFGCVDFIEADVDTILMKVRTFSRIYKLILISKKLNSIL